MALSFFALQKTKIFKNIFKEEKIIENPKFIMFTFYELRVKYNLSEKDSNVFLYLLRNKLTNDQYKVYLTGEKFEFNHAKMAPQDNELLITIKEAEKK